MRRSSFSVSTERAEREDTEGLFSSPCFTSRRAPSQDLPAHHAATNLNASRHRQRARSSTLMRRRPSWRAAVPITRLAIIRADARAGAACVGPDALILRVARAAMERAGCVVARARLRAHEARARVLPKVGTGMRRAAVPRAQIGRDAHAELARLRSARNAIENPLACRIQTGFGR